MKGLKNQGRASSRRYLAFGLIIGFFFLLITYYKVSDQFVDYSSSVVVRAPTIHVATTSPIVQNSLNSTKDGLQEAPNESKPKEKSFEETEETEKTETLNKEQVVEVKEKATPISYNDTDKTTLIDNEKRTEPDKQEINQFMKEEQKETAQGPQNFNQPLQKRPLCDRSDAKFDLCDLIGDARTIGSASVVLLIPPTENSQPEDYKIKPYSRKYIDGVKEVAVKSLDSPKDAPPCAGRVNYPAIVFAMGGLSGNYWHDFTDILIPLYIRSRQFDGEVQFLVTNIQPWWISKYDLLFKKLSRYEIIDFDKDYEVRCYPRVLVSYGSYKEFSIDPSRTPNGYSMVDFTKFIRNTYSLKREYPIKLRENPGRKTRLMIIARGGSRKFVNAPELVQSAQNLGFEVTLTDAKPDVSIADIAREVNSFDVMLGVHGAGLTNCIFLPTNAVLIQIVPYGKIEHLAKIDFGDPAVDMQLKYLEYSITAEESTLLDIFGKDHPIIKDPLAIHQSDWGKVGEWYLGKQDIRLDIRRFEPILQKAMEFLQ